MTELPNQNPAFTQEREEEKNSDGKTWRISSTLRIVRKELTHTRAAWLRCLLLHHKYQLLHLRVETTPVQPIVNRKNR